MGGIVRIESTVLKETILTESGVSAPYVEENMVVIAAVGAAEVIVIATNISPLIPQKYIPNSVSSGKITSFNAIEKTLLKLVSAFKRLLLAK